QFRESGDSYITHPLVVATILAELGMDTTTLVAALLHDTVEDTGMTVREIEAEFGAEVAHLIDSLTMLDKVQYSEAAEPRDDPQDDRRDDPRPPGAAHQAGRPAAQHAHPAVPAAAQAGTEGPGDTGSARPASHPARHEHHRLGT